VLKKPDMSQFKNNLFWYLETESQISLEVVKSILNSGFSMKETVYNLSPIDYLAIKKDFPTEVFEYLVE
jgi:hypothetical protein